MLPNACFARRSAIDPILNLLREVEKRIGILAQFAACFRDFRKPELVEHTVAKWVGQRVYGLALGYEDLNDHDDLRRDPLLAVLVDKEHRLQDF